jgi:hypothetical protein
MSVEFYLNFLFSNQKNVRPFGYRRWRQIKKRSKSRGEQNRDIHSFIIDMILHVLQ